MYSCYSVKIAVVFLDPSATVSMDVNVFINDRTVFLHH